MSFIFIHFECQAVLFDPWRELYQVLPLRARVELAVIAMKEYSALPKAPALLEIHPQIV